MSLTSNMKYLLPIVLLLAACGEKEELVEIKFIPKSAGLHYTFMCSDMERVASQDLGIKLEPFNMDYMDMKVDFLKVKPNLHLYQYRYTPIYKFSIEGNDICITSSGLVVRNDTIIYEDIWLRGVLDSMTYNH